MHLSRLTTSILFTGLFCLLANRAAAQWVQQQIVLKPGWNAVFLEVDPNPADCDALFTGLPIESVWDWNRTSDTAQFVQNADSLLPGMSYGFFNQRHRGHRVLSQSGRVPGMNNLVLLVPDQKLGFYLVANGGRAMFGAALRDTLLADTSGQRSGDCARANDCSEQ